MGDHAIVTGSIIGYKSLRDGTLRLQIDIEPRYVPAFHQTFPENDLAVAIARLTNEAAVEDVQPKGGPMAQDAAMLCTAQEFQQFISTKRDQTDAFYAPTEENAVLFLYMECNVDSRIELDHRADAANRYRGVKSEFISWLEGRPK